MAQLGAVHSVGESIIEHLRTAHQLQRQVEASPGVSSVLPECSFQQLSGGTLSAGFTPSGNELTLYLFRLRHDTSLRTTGDTRTPSASRSRPLSLELHYLMTAWSGDDFAEQTILSWAMRELHMRPAFDRSRLIPTERWRADELVQVVPAELSNEDLMRVWDALRTSYRLSVCYLARVVRVDSLVEATAGPVVATRYSYAQHRSLVDAAGFADALTEPEPEPSDA